MFLAHKFDKQKLVLLESARNKKMKTSTQNRANEFLRAN